MTNMMIEMMIDEINEIENKTYIVEVAERIDVDDYREYEEEVNVSIYNVSANIETDEDDYRFLVVKFFIHCDYEEAREEAYEDAYEIIESYAKQMKEANLIDDYDIH